MINKSEADWFHVDVMDGVFVPNISFGFPVMKSLQKLATKTLDVHLMIVQPERYITDFKDAGANILSVHYEACTHLHRTIYAIKEATPERRCHQPERQQQRATIERYTGRAVHDRHRHGQGETVDL